MESELQTSNEKLETPLLVSIEEHEQGWKDVEVTLRSGASEVVRLSAPPWRKALELGQQWLADGLGAVVLACVPADKRSDDWLDKLDLESVNRLSICAYALTFGEKKMRQTMEMGKQLMMASATRTLKVSEPRLPVSATVTEPEKSADGVSPSSVTDTCSAAKPS